MTTSILLKPIRIIIPVFVRGSGNLYTNYKTINLVRDIMCATFGGVTVTEGKGSWRDGGDTKTDNVTILDTIGHPNETDRLAVDGLVSVVFKNTNCLSVYVQYPQGNVKIIEREDHAEKIHYA